MIYFQLLFSFIKVGMFSIGGGYAAIPLIQSEIVTGHGWLSMAEFTDLITIAEMTPGPIAVNSATFVGIRIVGIFGAIVATIGCILPSCLIVSFLAYIYYKYRNVSALQSMLACLRPAVVALIASAGVSIFLLVGFGESNHTREYLLDRSHSCWCRFRNPTEIEMEPYLGNQFMRCGWAYYRPACRNFQSIHLGLVQNLAEQIAFKVILTTSCHQTRSSLL